MIYDSNFIRSLDSRTYWAPTKKVCDDVLDAISKDLGEKPACVEVMDYLTKIMWDSSEGVGLLQQERIRRGEIEDTGQSSVSVAGHNFQALVGYCLEINRLVGNLPKDIMIVLRPLRHRIIRKYATIEVGGGEAQKPDVDVLIYKEPEDAPIMICSCKTSLRERAGQTYRWKLLMDMAMCHCEHDEGCPMNKYDLKYEPGREILVTLITGDFYNERNSAQQRGMFTFFDHVFVSQTIEEFANVQMLSRIIDILNGIYS